MIDKERILGYIRRNGPVIPAQISKEINQNILMSSAVLSEMVSTKELRVSGLKIGGSPLYYLEGQEPQLINFAGKMNPRDKPAFEMLKDRKVLRDSFLPPPLRVSLRALKDFAVPLQVTLNDKKEIFWKWFLLPNSDAELSIKDILGITAAQEKEKEDRRLEELRRQEQESKDALAKAAADSEAQSAKAPVKEVAKHVHHEKDKAHPREEKQETVADSAADAVVLASGSNGPPADSSVQEHLQSAESSGISGQETVADATASAQAPQLSAGHDGSVALAASGEKHILRKKQVLRPKDIKDKFMKVVDDFFAKNSIEVISTEFVKKGEVNCIISIPTVIGKIEYFVKIKSKKTINDTDLNHAYLEGKDRNVNTLFLTNGDLTNKVKDLLNTRYKSLIYRKLSSNGI